MRTKTQYFAIMLGFWLSLSLSAQGLPVYDNTNFISLTKTLIESAKQTNELLKTVEFLKEQKENLVLVNDVLRQLRAVKELNRNHQLVFQMVRNDLREILDSPYIQPKEMSKISDSFETVLNTALDDLEFIEQILSSDFFKMTDAERTAILKEKETRSKELVAEINSKMERYRDIISFRRMQDIINTRTTPY